MSNKGRSAIVLGLASVVFSLVLSLAMKAPAQPTNPYGMVDPVAENHVVGYQIYVERCGSCHVALPPAVLPIESWQVVLSDRAHYGVTILDIPRFDQQLMQRYLQTYARRYQSRGTTPYRLANSDYFLALHPNIDLPQPLTLRTCTSCHLNAPEQDYTGAVNPS